MHPGPVGIFYILQKRFDLRIITGGVKCVGYEVTAAGLEYVLLLQRDRCHLKENLKLIPKVHGQAKYGLHDF